MSVIKYRIIEFPSLNDLRGNLIFMENNRHIPFDIKRIFYVFNVPADARRGGHAHKMVQEVIIPLAGSVDISVDDGITKNIFHLNKPFQGLYVSSMIWRELYNYSPGSILLVLASTPFDPSDYYKNYQEFLLVLRGQHEDSFP